jgi:hypothetical protein
MADVEEPDHQAKLRANAVRELSCSNLKIIHILKSSNLKIVHKFFLEIFRFSEKDIVQIAKKKSKKKKQKKEN